MAIWGRIECRVKLVWNHPATGWFILCGLIIACPAFWVWPQPTGYAVTILGGVAAIMTFRAMEHTQKFLLTLAIFAFVGVELRNIHSDRVKANADQAAALKENRDGFAAIASDLRIALKQSGDGFAAIADGLKTVIADNERKFEATMKRSNAIISKANEAAAFASGGDTFPEVFPALVHQANGVVELGFYLTKRGRYPLYGLTVFVGRPYRVTQPNQTRTLGTSFKLNEFNREATYPILIVPLPSEDVAYYTASMSARNGMWEEVIESRKVGARTFLRWTLFGEGSPGVTPNKQLEDLANSGFPSAERHISIYPLNIEALPLYAGVN
jgi:hypothetical protein